LNIQTGLDWIWSGKMGSCQTLGHVHPSPPGGEAPSPPVRPEHSFGAVRPTKDHTQCAPACTEHCWTRPFASRRGWLTIDDRTCVYHQSAIRPCSCRHSRCVPYDAACIRSKYCHNNTTHLFTRRCLRLKVVAKRRRK